MIFLINHCHWGRWIGKNTQKTKQTHFFLTCIYIYVEIRRAKLIIYCLYKGIGMNTWLSLMLHVQVKFPKQHWDMGEEGPCKTSHEAPD